MSNSEVPLAKGVIRGKKQIVTIGFAPDLLKRIDAAAADMGISRAAFINLACSRLLKEVMPAG